MTHTMTLEMRTAEGTALQSLALALDAERKAGRPTGGKLAPLLRNVRVGARGASMQVPDSVAEIQVLTSIARMLKISLRERIPQDRHFKHRLNEIAVLDAQLERALKEAKKSPLQRLADAAG